MTKTKAYKEKFKRRRMEFGGLAITVFVGEIIRITYGEEVLELSYHGSNNLGNHTLSFRGPHSFQIKKEDRNWGNEA